MLRLLFCFLVALAAAPAAADPPFTSDRISVQVTGSGPDVLLIPGLSSSPDVWQSTVAAAPGHRYHLIHVSGFAGQVSGANASGPVLVPVAEEIARYVAAAHLERPAVVGHSMGGSLALLVAGRHPGLVSKVMVVDMMPYLGAMFRRPGMTDEQLTQLAGSIRAQMLATEGEARRPQLDAMIGSMVRTEAARPALVAHAMASDRAVSAQSYYDLIVTNLTAEVANIHVPLTVLYVLPTGAPLTEEQIDDYYRLSYQGAPQAVLHRVPDSAHFIMIDQPGVFQAALREFLGTSAR